MSNCHYGLAGVSLGDMLIKGVVEELVKEFPNLTNLVTLSPMPGLRAWINETAAHVRALIRSARPRSAGVEDLRPELVRLAASYLTSNQRETIARSTGPPRAIDQVGHFHLANGAEIEQIDWWANPTPVGWERSLGHDRGLTRSTNPPHRGAS